MAEETPPAWARGHSTTSFGTGDESPNLETYAHGVVDGSVGGRGQFRRDCILFRIEVHRDRHDKVHQTERDRPRLMHPEDELADRTVKDLRWRNVVPGEGVDGEHVDLIFAGAERVRVEMEDNVRPPLEIDDVVAVETARLVEHIGAVRADDVDVDADARHRLVMDQRGPDDKGLQLSDRKRRFTIDL